MILQALILAVACTGVVQNGPTTHTLYYDVGRGLIGNMWLSDDDSVYINTYVEFENFRVTYNSGQITGMYCDAIDLIFEQYDTTDTFQGSFDRSFTELSNYNLFGVDLEIENFNGASNIASYYLYINDIATGATNITLDSDYVVPYIKANITFLEDNFYTYYDYNVGNTSYQAGYDRGYQVGFGEGQVDGYSKGYDKGFDDAFNADTTALTIFSGITTIAMLPIDMFLRMFNFEVLGINLTSFITGLLTLYIVLYMIKTVTGSKSKGD